MPTDDKPEEGRKRPKKARKKPLKGTGHTDAELNARVRDFPSIEEIWNAGNADPTLLNPSDTLCIRGIQPGGEDTKLRIGKYFFRMGNSIIDPTVVRLNAHLQIRRYKNHVTVKWLQICTEEDRIKEGLSNWNLSDHEVRRSVALLDLFYATDAVRFRRDACEAYRTRFEAWLSRGARLHRGRQSISTNKELLEALTTESDAIKALTRALEDAQSAAFEWQSILSGRNTPTVNKLYRILNPSKQGVNPMVDKELLNTSIFVSFFGCTNAAAIYPRLMAFEDVFNVLRFLGCVNLGRIAPNPAEAEAFLRYCDADRGPTMSTLVDNLLCAADSLCDWKEHRSVLAESCRATIEADKSGQPPPSRHGRLWPMV